MATLRSDIIVPEVFVPYVVEATTNLDRFLQSGVVQPLSELNGTEGGDFVNIPFWSANLAGDQEVLSDSASLTPGKITASKQIGVQLHRGRAFEARDLASIAAGSDAMAAIGNKLAAYIANQKQKDLLAVLEGVFGSLNANSSSSAFFSMCVDSESGDTPTVLSPRTVAAARNKFGEQGDKLTAVAIHSATYYDLVERKLIDYVSTADARGTTTTQSGGTMANSYGGDDKVPTFCGLNVIVSDDVSTTGSGSSTEYAAYFFQPGSVGSGEQAALDIEQDRDILAKSDAISYDTHYCYHPSGAKWAVTTTNPTIAQLQTVGNWSNVYENKNLGVARATVVSNYD